MRGERWKGCWEELKVVGVAEGAVKRITRTLQCASSAWLSGFQFFSFSGGYGGKPRQTSFGMKKTRRAFHGTAASGKHKSADLRAILRVYLAAALGSVVAWIGDSCSGYAGFRPCLLSNGGCLSLSLSLARSRSNSAWTMALLPDTQVLCDIFSVLPAQDWRPEVRANVIRGWGLPADNSCRLILRCVSKIAPV